MKTSVAFISSAILFLLSPAVLLCAAAPAPASSAAPVLDADGKPVRSGVKYYVVPVTSKHVGGLDLAPTGEHKCSQSVVQVSDPKLPGQTAAFYPVNPKDAVVRNGTDLNVEFPDAASVCSNSSNFWSISGDPDSVDMHHFVRDGGKKGGPGVNGDAINWFQILKTEKGYKFHFCPVAVCECNPVCADVGVTVGKGKRLLELNSKYSLEVNFKRADKK